MSFHAEIVYTEKNCRQNTVEHLYNEYDRRFRDHIYTV